MNDNKYAMKEVYFEQYCRTCENKETKSEDDPCYSCLANPVNLYSHKPMFYKSKGENNA